MTSALLRNFNSSVFTNLGHGDEIKNTTLFCRRKKNRIGWLEINSFGKN